MLPYRLRGAAPIGALVVAALLGAGLRSTALHAAELPVPQDTMIVQHPEVVVSATRTTRPAVNVPNATAVITGKELRRQGVRNLAEALQDVVGLDTGEGSDNGPRLPNVGMWGLKEFDALLFTVNGVPIGGPFNPSLAQVPIDDVERIEVVKGPQGTMYGVSAFAGMVQAFTAPPGTGGHVTVGGASFQEGHGSFNWNKALAKDRTFGLTGSYSRNDGWQDRTGYDRLNGTASYGFGMMGGKMTLDLTGIRDHQDWGTPVPFEDGHIVPGFDIGRNYAVADAHVNHDVIAATARYSRPLGSERRLENTLAYTYDAQDFLRSWPISDSLGDVDFPSNGLQMKPKENSLYEDLRMVSAFEGRGLHELVTGAALTWGKTNGTAHEFEFDQGLDDYGNVPTVDQITEGEDRDFEDMRTFLGLYAHDAWTPQPRLTLEGGARFDAVFEELETEADLPGGPQKVKDSRDDQNVSGDVSALVRLVPPGGTGRLQTANLYGSWRTGFKPSAPNLAEAEAAEILEPERTQSWEVGLKTRSFAQLAVDLSYFDMTFRNMVVSTLGANNLPELTNAGKQRFKGFEANARWSPAALPGSAIDVGYAHHDARFVDFTDETPDGLVDVSGKQIEMVAQELVSVRPSLQLRGGVGVFAAYRYQGKRPFDRINSVFANAYSEWDAGASLERGTWRISLVGRNLGNDRHVVTESEIGPDQFYMSPPRRATVEVSYKY